MGVLTRHLSINSAMHSSTPSATRHVYAYMVHCAFPTSTEPQPDVQLLVPRDDFYVGGHPTQSDALLVVEVADTSLAYDRNEKSVIYSMRGVPELWILDVNRPRLFVMREPAELGYRVVMELEAGDVISPLALPDLSFAVSDLLSPLL